MNSGNETLRSAISGAASELRARGGAHREQPRDDREHGETRPNCVAKLQSGLPCRAKALKNSDVCGIESHWDQSNIPVPAAEIEGSEVAAFDLDADPLSPQPDTILPLSLLGGIYYTLL